MSDDDPLDLAQVSADDAAIEQLRAHRGDPSDPVVALLRDLLVDVEADLPGPTPVGRGSTVLALAGEHGSERRSARNGAVVALLTAGIVSLGGMAAASTVDNPANPLHGLGEAVRAAADAVVHAVTPPRSTAGSPAGGSAGAAVPAPRADAPRAVVPAPGATLSAAARSQVAVRQVNALLIDAAQLLQAGRPSAAAARLDTAEVRLGDVLPAERAALAQRLADLRARIDTRTAPPPPAEKERPAQAPAAKPDQPQQAEQGQQNREGAKPAAKPDAPASGGPKAQQQDGPEQPAAQEIPANDAGAATTSERLTPGSRPSGRQSARLASAKPRA